MKGLGEKQDLLEQQAISKIISFGKSEQTEPTAELTEKVSKALEVFNKSSSAEVAGMHRQIAARQLLNSSIYALNKQQFDKVKKTVLAIAQDFEIEQKTLLGTDDLSLDVAISAINQMKFFNSKARETATGDELEKLKKEFEMLVAEERIIYNQSKDIKLWYSVMDKVNRLYCPIIRETAELRGALQQVKDHMDGKIELKTAKSLIDENENT